MVYKIDYLEDVYEWSIAPDGPEYERVSDYAPTLYAVSDGRNDGSGDLIELRERLECYPAVISTEIGRWRRGFRHEHEDVLEIEVARLDDVCSVADRIRGLGRPGAYECFNVDFSREFRYCLENELDPAPAKRPSTLAIEVEPLEVAEPPITELTIDGEAVSGSATAILHAVQHRIEQADPDVLILSSSEIIPVLHETATAHGIELQLGRLPGWQQLAAESTYESYGSVGHSPARYNVPGRAIIDRSNTFFFEQSGLDGCLDMVQRSGKPLQEVAWASIGNVLTAIQIREARRRGVLVPWNSWRHEFFKPLSTLHGADRGGYTFSPDVGFHEDVHELDFSSLYPNVICRFNISPETICCECHGDREDVPELGYSICEKRGYLVDVLQPLIDARDELKRDLRDAEDPEREATLRARADAIKWILVSCFGYQGFSNAKFGRIECHEAINAYAREILLDAKEVLEANGWRLVHGIVDGLWVTAVDGEERVPLEELAAAITERIGIRLEYEAAFEWVAFVPLRDSDQGALTKYFGKTAESDREDSAYKYRGIERRQRSTPAWIADAQQELVETLDQHRSPNAVCARLQRRLAELRAGGVDPQELAINNRASARMSTITTHEP